MHVPYLDSERPGADLPDALTDRCSLVVSKLFAPAVQPSHQDCERTVARMSWSRLGILDELMLWGSGGSQIAMRRACGHDQHAHPFFCDQITSNPFMFLSAPTVTELERNAVSGC